MISKELLNAVLGEELYLFHLWNIEDNELLYYTEANGGGKRINIYELAHKCKEWAYNNSYILRSQLKVCYCRFPNHNDIEEKIFKANTESEAIFAACQWILDNKN